MENKERVPIQISTDFINFSLVYDKILRTHARIIFVIHCIEQFLLESIFFRYTLFKWYK